MNVYKLTSIQNIVHNNILTYFKTWRKIFNATSLIMNNEIQRLNEIRTAWKSNLKII